MTVLSWGQAVINITVSLQKVIQLCWTAFKDPESIDKSKYIYLLIMN